MSVEISSQTEFASVIFPTHPTRGQLLTPAQAMRLAMAEAELGNGYVSPNPMVGCVVLDANGGFLSKGYHAKYGGPHAEVAALKGLSEAELKGATLFVTLEPCAHEGKTPSCAKAIAKLPVREVVYGLVDPNPLVAGQGAQILQAAGLRTTLWGQWTAQLEEVCEHFLTNFREHRPFVSLKVASSLDGQLALKTGESKWITSAGAREYGHYLRATHDAMLVGVGTILQDDPSLNIRHPRFPGKTGKLVVLDPEGKCLQRPDLHIFKLHKPEDLIIVVTQKSLKSEKARVLQAPTLGDKGLVSIDIKQLLIKLWDLKVRSILVEGGAQTLSSFIMQNQADRLYLFQAPVVLGAASGKSWSEQVNIDSMRGKFELQDLRSVQLPPDFLVTGRFTHK